MITLRHATPDDLDAIASMLSEIDRYYGAAEVPDDTERLAAIESTIFGTLPAAQLLLAWNGTRLIGLAAYSYVWPAAGVTRSLYLKELYVTEASRRDGVGRLLMQQLCRIASDIGCSRVEWTADTDNAVAQGFYGTLGVAPDPTKLFYRLNAEAMSRMARDAPGVRELARRSERHDRGDD